MSRRLVMVLQVVIGVLFLSAIAINFANVIGRYVFLRPVLWAEEVMAYAMVWLVMLGAAVATWDAAHLKMEAAYDLLPPSVRRALNFAIGLVTVVMSVYVVYLTLQVLQRLAATGQRSVAAGMPMVIPFAAVAVGFSAIAVLAAVRLRVGAVGPRRSEEAELPKGGTTSEDAQGQGGTQAV